MRDRAEIDSKYATLGSQYGFDISRAWIDQSKMFFKKHHKNIESDESSFVSEDLLIALSIANFVLLPKQPVQRESFIFAALSLVISALILEFSSLGQHESFASLANDRISQYACMRFGGMEDGSLGGSFQWEAPLIALGTNYPNPGTLLQYKLHLQLMTSLVGDTVNQYLQNLDHKPKDGIKNGKQRNGEV